MYKPYIDDQEVAEAPISSSKDVGSVTDVSQPVVSERLKRVSFAQLLKLNKPDWYLVLVGILLSTAMGCLFPLMATFFGDVLGVCTYHTQLSGCIVIHFLHRYLVVLTLKKLKMVLEA